MRKNEKSIIFNGENNRDFFFSINIMLVVEPGFACLLSVPVYSERYTRPVEYTSFLSLSSNL